MIIEDFDGEVEVTRPEEIEAAMRKRHDGFNSFWLYQGDEQYPSIAILAKEDFANIHYFPKERHPGFQSVADKPVANPRETTVFFNRPTEEVWITNYSIIPFSDALKVAQEFAVSPKLPKCITWTEM